MTINIISRCQSCGQEYVEESLDDSSTDEEVVAAVKRRQRKVPHCHCGTIPAVLDSKGLT